jgi:hypothetical protein
MGGLSTGDLGRSNLSRNKSLIGVEMARSGSNWYKDLFLALGHGY